MFDLAQLESLDRGLANIAVLRDELADRIAETQSVLSFGRLLPDQAGIDASDTGSNVVYLVPKGGRHG